MRLQTIGLRIEERPSAAREGRESRREDIDRMARPEGFEPPTNGFGSNSRDVAVLDFSCPGSVAFVPFPCKSLTLFGMTYTNNITQDLSTQRRVRCHFVTTH